jgi:hypothetical protein
MQARTTLRFNPQVLVLMLLALGVFWPLREAIGAFVWWKYRSTYQQLDFVVTETVIDSSLVRGQLVPIGTAVPIDSPTAPATLPGEPWVMEIATVDGVVVFAHAPSVPVTPGARVLVWWSAEAPAIGYGSGRATNIALVSALPQLPGPTPFVIWLAIALAVLWFGLKAIVWAAKRAHVSIREHG